MTIDRTLTKLMQVSKKILQKPLTQLIQFVRWVLYIKTLKRSNVIFIKFLMVNIKHLHKNIVFFKRIAVFSLYRKDITRYT